MENKFKVFVIAAIVALIIAVSAVAFILIQKIDDNSDGSQVVVEITPELVEVSMGEAIMTNIAIGEDEIQHFAKIKISLGVDKNNKKDFEAFNLALIEKSASVRNELISVVGEQTYNMLKATDGKTKLADEMVIRINKLLGTDIVHEVYYEDYFVQ